MHSIDSLLSQVRDEHNEFRNNATTWDWVRETVKMLAAGAIIYRMTAQVVGASALGIDLTDDDINYEPFAPVIPKLEPRVDLAIRATSALLWIYLGVTWGPSFGGGPAAAALVLTNVAILVVDPLVWVSDALTNY